MKPPTSAARRHLRPDRLFFSAAVAVMLASVGRVPSVESSSLLLFFFSSSVAVFSLLVVSRLVTLKRRDAATDGAVLGPPFDERRTHL